MTYNELRAALKTFKSQGLTTIALNAKKDILQAEYDRLTTQVDAITTTEVIETVVIDDIQTVETVTMSDGETTVTEVNETVTDEATVNEVVAVETVKTVALKDIETILNSEVTPDIATEDVEKTVTPDEAVESDSIVYPSPMDYDPEQSIDYFAFLDEAETIDNIATESTETATLKKVDDIVVNQLNPVHHDKKLPQNENIATDESLAKLMTVNLIIFLVAVITTVKKALSTASRIMEAVGKFSIEFNHHFDQWLSGFNLPQFA